MIRSTDFSLPGIVFEENRNRSPSAISRPRYLPRDSCAEAARRSPWLPVTISIRLSRGISTACSGVTVFGKSFRTPVVTAASIIRRIARPRRQTERPAACPASASVFTRATFDAKVVATTMPRAFDTSASRSPESVASDRPGASEKALVESHTSARMPGFAISR